MKMKKVIAALILIVIMVMMSGCVNVTYNVKLKNKDKVDVNIEVLYSSNDYIYDEEKIEKIKKAFEDKDYTVKENIKKNGMSGFSLSKKNIKLSDKEPIEFENYKIDIIGDLFKNFEYKKGLLRNSYIIDSDIDLTNYDYKMDVKDKEGNLISDEDYKKLLSELNLKLSIEVVGCNSKESNTKLVSSDSNASEWVIIPGEKTKVELTCKTGDTKAIFSTIIILAFITLVCLALFITFLKMYITKQKSNKK